MNCNQVLDHLPLYAIGALSDKGAQLDEPLEEHLRACQSCQQELDELTAAATLLTENLLTESVTPGVLRPQVKLALLERIDSESLSPSVSIAQDLPDQSLVAKQSWRTYMPYIAATLCAVAVGFLAARSADQPNFNPKFNGPTDQGISTWQQRIAAAEQAFGTPRIQLARLAADSGGKGLAVAVFCDGLSGEYHVLVSNATPPSPGRQLWLWIFDPQGVRLSHGPAEYLGQGHAAAIVKLPVSGKSLPERVAKVILTEEPPGEHTAPSGPMVGQSSESETLQ